jgi:FtsP/CotA-like multicopper oxidase with cupredoxin domain
MPDMAQTGPIVARHGPEKHGPANTAVAEVQRNRLGERPTGLEKVPHRVLVYTDLQALEPNPDPRPPEREIDVHLTGNMETFMWGFDGRKFSEIREPIYIDYGERVRITMVNDTMMEHPMHIHGTFMEIVNGAEPARRPRKHTISVKAAERLSFDFTGDDPGNWAFHCHLLYHMDAGMMRVVNVGLPAGEVRS